MYCVNPPVTRSLAALPAYFLGTEEGWANLEYEIRDRPEFRCGDQLVASHPGRWRTFLVLGRLLFIPFVVVGGITCYRWARDLYGTSAAFTALLLWCFEPSILTWNAVICSDGLATSFGLAACYAFWRWLKDSRWDRAFVAGGLLGLVQLTKTSWIILFPVWIVLWTTCHRSYRNRISARTQIVQLATIFLLAGYIVNSGYAFVDSFACLGDYQFLSRTLAGTEAIADGSASGGNRFANSVFAGCVVPVPMDYLRGIDLQKVDFEQGRQAYLLGNQSDRGWWYYYLIGLCIKTTLGTIGLAANVVALALARLTWTHTSKVTLTSENQSIRSERMADNLVLALPPLSLFVFVSAQTGINSHMRYVLPCIPFALVWLSQIAARIPNGNKYRVHVVALLAASVCESLAVYPHCMSFFNLAAGGPTNGYLCMRESSCSWSQDVFYLKAWLDRHVGSTIPFINVSAAVPIAETGIVSRGSSPMFHSDLPVNDGHVAGPVPGVHAVNRDWIVNPKSGYGYFAEFTSIARVGYSIDVYSISHEEVNRVRKKLGLSSLPSSTVSESQFLSRLRENADGKSELRVGVFVETQVSGATEGIDRIVACFETLPNASCSLLDAAAVVNGGLKDVDVVVFPGGSASKQAAALGIQGKKCVRQFVTDGGGYVGICAGAHLGSSAFDWGLSIVDAQVDAGTHFVPGVGDHLWLARGFGKLQVTLSEAGKSVFVDAPCEFQSPYTGGPVLRPGRRTDLPGFVTLARYASEVYEYEYQRGTMIGTPAIAAAPYGAGKVMLISPHLEFVPELRGIVAQAAAAVASAKPCK